MEPNCKHCTKYKNKKCTLHNIPIENPENTTCLKFMPIEPKRSLIPLIYIASFTVLVALVANYFAN